MRTTLATSLCLLWLAGQAGSWEEMPQPELSLPGFAVDLAPQQISESRVRIVPYGSLWGNMVYASERTNPGPFTLYVFSRDQQGEDTFFTDARRSRFGLEVSGPELEILGGLRSGGRVEIDFIGEFLESNQARARLREVYWEARNERHRLLVGQTWDVVSPLRPHTINFSVGWFGGNIGFRRAQFRYEKLGDFSEDLAWTFQTSLNEDVTPDFPSEPGVVREASDYPMLEARGALILYPKAGVRATTLGVSGHIGETGFDFLTFGPPPLDLPPLDDARFLSWSYNFDLSAPIGSRARLQAEFFHGRNLSPLLGGIGQGVCACTRTSVESIGGWAELSFDYTDRLTTNVGSGIDDPVNSDLQVGRTLNQFAFANIVFAVTPFLSTGLEVAYWRTLYQDRRVGIVADDELGPRAPGKAATIEWMVKYDF